MQIVLSKYNKYIIKYAVSSCPVLKRSVENQHPCVVPDHREKTFSHSQLSMMLAVNLYEIEEFPSSHTLLRVFCFFKSGVNVGFFPNTFLHLL